jgi:hypothetical protein
VAKQDGKISWRAVSSGKSLAGRNCHTRGRGANAFPASTRGNDGLPVRGKIGRKRARERSTMHPEPVSPLSQAPTSWNTSRPGKRNGCARTTSGAWRTGGGRIRRTGVAVHRLVQRRQPRALEAALAKPGCPPWEQLTLAFIEGRASFEVEQAHAADQQPHGHASVLLPLPQPFATCRYLCEAGGRHSTLSRPHHACSDASHNRAVASVLPPS